MLNYIFIPSFMLYVPTTIYTTLQSNKSTPLLRPPWNFTTYHHSLVQQKFSCISTLTYVQTSNTNKHTHGISHTHLYELKDISQIPNYVTLFLATYVVHNNFKYIQPHTRDCIFTRIPVADSKFLYFIFIDKLYACTPFKIFITDSLFLSFNSLIFNPACSNYILPSSTGIHFHIPLFPYIYFLKGLNHNLLWFTCDCPTQLTHVLLSRPFLQNSLPYIQKNSPHLIKK